MCLHVPLPAVRRGSIISGDLGSGGDRPRRMRPGDEGLRGDARVRDPEPEPMTAKIHGTPCEMPKSDVDVPRKVPCLP